MLFVHVYCLYMPSLDIFEQQLDRVGRRLHTELIVCYKTMFGLVDVSFNDFFQYPLLPIHEAIRLSCSKSTAQTEPAKAL